MYNIQNRIYIFFYHFSEEGTSDTPLRLYELLKFTVKKAIFQKAFFAYFENRGTFLTFFLHFLGHFQAYFDTFSILRAQFLFAKFYLILCPNRNCAEETQNLIPLANRNKFCDSKE